MADFAVWAPDRDRVRLKVAGTEIHLMRSEDGWWRAQVPHARAGTDYAYLLDDDDHPLPDPRSLWQPHGVHGTSRVYDHDAYPWTDRGWTGRALPGSVVYELHVGTFTPEGTFASAIDRLDHLVDLGVDLIELLPVAAFNGTHNWGYDGVCWYAPHEGYGGPDGLKSFVDACHARGMGVLLDAVYNHFGPSGAYAPMFAPYLSAVDNPWGRSINLDGPGSDEVRRYIVDSALMWLRDYHIDGLRLDAVHAFVDRGATHLLEQLAVEVDALATHVGRPLSLIAESDLNDPRLVTSRDGGGYGLTAQWADDVHHALHTLLSGERQGYYADFGTTQVLAHAMTSAFVHDGTWSSFRQRTHGRPVDRTRVPGHRFVAYLQNHDQIGNRAMGDRLSATVPAGLLRVGAVLLFTGPFTPMLFMGEEWAAGTPWQYFTTHPEPDLAEAVRTGRRREFASHGWAESEVPDPQDAATRERSTLDWSEPDRPEHKEMLDFYRALIALRRRYPQLSDPRLDHLRVQAGDQFLVIERNECVGRGECVMVVANLAAVRRRIGLPGEARDVLLATEPGVTLNEMSVELPARSAAVLVAEPAR